MDAKKPITPKRLREVLNYNPDTGLLTWRIRRGKSTPAGKIAGSLNHDGYIHVRVDKLPALAHRIAWVLMTGRWPKNQLDHRDRNRANNRWANLRLATASQNQANTGLSSRNTSGRKGVTWVKSRNKWQATIRVDGRHLHIGFFDSLAVASAAYQEVARNHHGEFARAA